MLDFIILTIAVFFGIASLRTATSGMQACRKRAAEAASVKAG